MYAAVLSVALFLHPVLLSAQEAGQFGWVTIENNTGNAGLLIEGGRVETFGQRPASSTGPVQGGPTVIRNNFNGVASPTAASSRPAA